jgi:hypothetical protein
MPFDIPERDDDGESRRRWVDQQVAALFRDPGFRAALEALVQSYADSYLDRLDDADEVEP